MSSQQQGHDLKCLDSHVHMPRTLAGCHKVLLCRAHLSQSTFFLLMSFSYHVCSYMMQIQHILPGIVLELWSASNQIYCTIFRVTAAISLPPNDVLNIFESDDSPDHSLASSPDMLNVDSHGTHAGSSRSSSKHLDVEELEMLLEAYFVQIDGTLNNLSAVCNSSLQLDIHKLFVHLGWCGNLLHRWFNAILHLLLCGEKRTFYTVPQAISSLHRLPLIKVGPLG